MLLSGISTIWDDQDTALRDLATQFAGLQTHFALDPARLLLAGFSLGGETALRAAAEAMPVHIAGIGVERPAAFPGINRHRQGAMDYKGRPRVDTTR